MPSHVTIVSESSQTRLDATTDPAGRLTFQHLPFGAYKVTVEHASFDPFSTIIAIHSEVPVDIHAQLSVKAEATTVVVSDTATMVDPSRTGVMYSVNSRQIQEEQSTVPGRGLLDLVDMQPGWLFEANGVLHQRGSEYQTLFVVDGIPLDENRSPAFAPGLQTGEVRQMSVLTANFPAEYGRKLGGVVDVTTAQDLRNRLHGSAELGGGSFDTESGFLSLMYRQGHSASQ